jgi:hypothetical protein
MLDIKLYTANPATNAPIIIDAVLALVNFTGKVKVSRTVGPANWYTLNKRILAGDKRVDFPCEDIEERSFTSIRGISKLSRKQSVLTVSYGGAEAPGLSLLHQALQNDVPLEAVGFYLSSAHFSFGPSDIFIPTVDKEGRNDVELVDVAQFIFSISCDRFRGRLSAFKEAVPTVPQFVKFRSELEQIVGPLKLRFSP